MLKLQAKTNPYLAEFLLAKGYEVHGPIRRASTFERTGSTMVEQEILEDRLRDLGYL